MDVLGGGMKTIIGLRTLFFGGALILFVIACAWITPTPVTPVTPTITPTSTFGSGVYHSTPTFQVFILTPVRTCIAANDFYSGDVAFGPNCGDHNCDNSQFDPPFPQTGIKPSEINDPKYANYAYRECFNITLTEAEIESIKRDVMLSRDWVYEWTDGALDFQVEFTILPHDHTGFTAPDFVFGPFEVDDELLNPYVTTETDLIYVITGARDREKGVDLAHWCGSSYGEYSIHGSSYSYIQYNEGSCNTVTIHGQTVYEATLHELFHNIDWALYSLSGVTDVYQAASPDWAKWDHASWPACNQGVADTLAWFPSIDFCEWDPDWIDCNNVASAGACLHASEVDGQMSWYEHVLRAHYPRSVHYVGNFCRDGRMDFGETGVDSGGPCL
jgi:hypothetical protein